MDHVGLLNTFDKNYMSKNCYENFVLEHNHKKNFREQNLAHEPYCILSKIISDYDFLFFEGNGGHVKGESLIVCEKLEKTQDSLQ